MAIKKVVFLSTLDSRRDRSSWFPVSFLSLLVFFSQQNRGVCLVYKEEGYDGAEAILQFISRILVMSGKTHQNGKQPKDPSPALRLRQKSAAQRTDDGADQRPHGPKRHRLSAPLDRDHVRDGARADCQRRDASDAIQEPEGDELVQVLGERARNGEQREEQVVGSVDPVPAVHLRQGRENKRSQREAEQVDGHDKGGHRVAVAPKVLHHVRHRQAQRWELASGVMKVM